MYMIEQNFVSTVTHTYFDICQIFVQFRIQWWQHVDRTVNPAVDPAQDVIQDKRGKWHIDNNTLFVDNR